MIPTLWVAQIGELSSLAGGVQAHTCAAGFTRQFNELILSAVLPSERETFDHWEKYINQTEVQRLDIHQHAKIGALRLVACQYASTQ